MNNRWTKDFLESKRRFADRQADAIVSELFSESADGEKTTRELLNQLIENKSLAPPGLPSVIRSFIEETTELPDWADPQKLRKAEYVFAMYGPEIVWILFCRSLPFCYACANGAEVLANTGRLNHPERDDGRVLNRRVMETAQYLMDVLAPGGFEPGGQAIAATRKIRLIHASIRYFLGQRGWDHERFGEPINQADMAGTLLSFSVVVTDGLRLLHVPLSDEQEEAFVHLWNVAGYFIGLDLELLPRDAEDARALQNAILKHQMAHSPAGEDLAQAILLYLERMLGAHFLSRFPAVLTRFMVGDEIADVLRIRHKKAHWPFYLFTRLIKWLADKEARFYPVRFITRRFNLLVLQGLIDEQNPVKKTHFRIPPGLSKDWGVDT